MKRWYTIRSKYRNETLLWQQLCSRSIEVYYPRLFGHAGQAPIQKAKPYFPGYMFVHVDLDIVGRSVLQWMPGAMSLVCFGGEPAFVSEAILRGIEERVNRTNRLRADPCQGIKQGDAVEIYSGPFAGYHGIFDSLLPDRQRAIVFLAFVRDQQIRVELPVTQVETTKQCRT